jgi:hypothetical protein
MVTLDFDFTVVESDLVMTAIVEQSDRGHGRIELQCISICEMRR